MRGVIKWFNNVKGYGFLTGQDGRDFFVHHSDLRCDRKTRDSLKGGEEVEFEESAGPKGPKAANIRLVAVA